MITVIIAGGSGTRLWPLSTPSYPKHLLKLPGEHKTLLQNTYERAKRLGNDVYVISDKSHAHHVKEQLSELGDHNLVVEPGRRGTANCFIAALSHIADKHDPDEPIAFMAADHYIRDTDGFVNSFKVAATASRKEGRIVLVGVEPDYPATGFGYIQKDGLFDEESLVYNVHSFKEKPEFELAQKFVKSGNYLWNCSYFIGSHNTFLNSISRHAPLMHNNYKRLKKAGSDEDYSKVYLSFDSDAIDYALMEHIVDDLLVVPAAFDWMDLGSYNDLHKAVGGDEQGNHIFGTHGDRIEAEGVENSYVQNYEDKPLAVIGLDNIVVINCPDGILVARKDLSKQIGAVSKRINNGRKREKK